MFCAHKNQLWIYLLPNESSVVHIYTGIQKGTFSRFYSPFMWIFFDAEPKAFRHGVNTRIHQFLWWRTVQKKIKTVNVTEPCKVSGRYRYSVQHWHSLYIRKAVCVTRVMTRHAMCEFHHAGVLYTFINSALSSPRPGQWCGPTGQTAWTVITDKITPCWVTLLQPARRAAVLGHTSSLRPF